jgi:hypothetical protein
MPGAAEMTNGLTITLKDTAKRIADVMNAREEFYAITRRTFDRTY